MIQESYIALVKKSQEFILGVSTELAQSVRFEKIYTTQISLFDYMHEFLIRVEKTFISINIERCKIGKVKKILQLCRTRFYHRFSCFGPRQHYRIIQDRVRIWICVPVGDCSCCDSYGGLYLHGSTIRCHP